jgi:hypothetical protein
MQPAQDGARKQLLKDRVSTLSFFILAISRFPKTNSFPSQSTVGNHLPGQSDSNEKPKQQPHTLEPRATPSSSQPSLMSGVRSTTKPSNAEMDRSGRPEGNRRHGQLAMED